MRFDELKNLTPFYFEEGSILYRKVSDCFAVYVEPGNALPVLVSVNTSSPVRLMGGVAR